MWPCGSPEKDLRYHAADYTAVLRPCGHLTVIETIIREAKARGMRVLADLVINHCSSEHEWFKDSRKSVNSHKRDWFIWRNAEIVNGQRQTPNNWRYACGGST